MIILCDLIVLTKNNNIIMIFLLLFVALYILEGIQYNAIFNIYLINSVSMIINLKYKKILCSGSKKTHYQNV